MNSKTAHEIVLICKATIRFMLKRNFKFGINSHVCVSSIRIQLVWVGNREFREEKKPTCELYCKGFSDTRFLKFNWTPVESMLFYYCAMNNVRAHFPSWIPIWNLCIFLSIFSYSSPSSLNICVAICLYKLVYVALIHTLRINAMHSWTKKKPFT